jgi:hypothetical protein
MRATRSRAWAISALLACQALAAGCSPLAWQIPLGSAAALSVLPSSRLNRMYRHTYRPAPDSAFVRRGDAYCGFVEMDEFGWFRDRGQPARVLGALDSLGRRHNLAVVVYVHGWRHNASRGDPDTKAFTTTLGYLNDELNAPVLSSVRAEVTNDPKITVVGVYLGWRAQVWPEAGRRWRFWSAGFWSGLLNLPVYPTTFSRNTKAGVVARGEVHNFISALSQMYKDSERRVLEDTDGANQQHLMSLVLVGHSYGGHLLFEATRKQFEDNLVAALATPSDPSQPLRTSGLFPDATHPGYRTCHTFVRGVGDLVVLVNPAIEAASYHRIDDLVRDTEFVPDQVPLLLTVSAENDGARKLAFNVKTGLQLLLEPMLNQRQSTLEHTALGVEESQLTHHLTLADDNDAARRHAKIEVLDTHGPQAMRRALEGLGKLGEASLRQSFEDTVVMGPFKLAPTRPGRRNDPMIVAGTSQQVINGHSDFFRVDFVNLLSSLALRVEYRKLGIIQKRRAHPGTP